MDRQIFYSIKLQLHSHLRLCQASIVEPEAATRGVLWKNVFLEISQNSQENTCARVSFLKSRRALLKKRLWLRRFRVNSKNTSGRLLL